LADTFGVENMEAKAVAKYIRMSPQKVRLVVDLVRGGKKVQESTQYTSFTPENMRQVLLPSVLKSAVANAARILTLTKKFFTLKKSSWIRDLH